MVSVTLCIVTMTAVRYAPALTRGMRTRDKIRSSAAFVFGIRYSRYTRTTLMCAAPGHGARPLDPCALQTRKNVCARCVIVAGALFVCTRLPHTSRKRE